MTECGNYPPAAGRTPYCPACDALERISAELPDDVYDAGMQVAFSYVNARRSRIKRLHQAYGRRR